MKRGDFDRGLRKMEEFFRQQFFSQETDTFCFFNLDHRVGAEFSVGSIEKRYSN